MTEKVKVTKLQADALKWAATDSKYWMDHSALITAHADAHDDWSGDMKPLNGMPLLTLVDALRIGYEVELEYKVGDWIARIDGADFYPKGGIRVVEVFEVYERIDGRIYVQHGEDGEWGTPITQVRHAIPEEIKAEKERRVWAGINRNVSEFRVGDAYKYTDGNWGVVLSDGIVKAAKRFYEEGRIVGLLPTESYVDLGEIVSFGEGDEG